MNGKTLPTTRRLGTCGIRKSKGKANLKSEGSLNFGWSSFAAQKKVRRVDWVNTA
jgi:hypothetical protein